VGIAAFLVPQLALFLTTSQAPIAVDDRGWFLNSGRNVATIGSVIGVVSALIAARRQWRLRDTATFGLGVLIAMVATLFTIGPGTIFPIVIIIGAALAGVATLVGTAVGYVVQMVSSRRN
jgi:hypothetical protein